MRRATRALRLLVAVVALTVPAGGLWAHGYRLGELAIGHIWAPPPAPGAAGLAVYGPILNRGSAPARLVGASSPVAAEARFRSVDKGGVRWPAAIELPPGKPVSLASWRAHIWLAGLKRPLAAGDAFELTLDFGAAGKLTVKVIVEAAPSD